MNETLKQIRINVLQYTEEDMAIKLGMSVNEYIQIENNPLDLLILTKLSQAVGMPIEKLLNTKKQEIKFDIDNAFKSVDELKDKLYGFINQAQHEVDSMDLEFKDLLDIVEIMTRKPRVALVGRSDVGKSTLINTLIGSKTLPAAWTPTTSIIIYVKHILDKPAYCVNNVMVFKSDENGNIWDDTKLSDEEYTKGFCIAEGDYNILQDYGSRQGINYDITNATSAVVFVESEILNNCDLLDLPGYGTKDREEDDSLLKKVKNIDILVYMSVANGFMNGNDINWLQGELPNLAPIVLNSKQLKPLSNLYIVASQAHTVSNGSIEELKNILRNGAERFEKTLSPNYWINIGQPTTSNDFRKRFFTYSTDQESLRIEFEKDLKTLLLKLPEIITDSVVNYVKQYAIDKKTSVEEKLNSFREILLEREKKKRLIEQIEANEPQRIYECGNKKIAVINKIKDFAHKASIDLTNIYNETLTIDNIIKIIEDNDWHKKEDDMKQLMAKLSNLLNDSYVSVLKKYSNDLSEDINKFINDYENTASFSSGCNEDEFRYTVGFNFKASFAGGLAGLATYGALSIWAASLGNLGAYILLAKGVGILAAMGIHVGGVGAAAAAIAAIGGPIVLAIGIAAILAGIAFAIFSGNWKKSVAKKIIEEFDKKNIMANFINLNTKFWKDTEMAFIQASDNMEKDYVDFISNFKKEVYENNDEEINAKISSCEYKIHIYNLLLTKL